jgi:hypothetical protein
MQNKMKISISEDAGMPDNLPRFTCFPILPKEVQVQIWESVDEGKNVITISTTFDKNGSPRFITASYKIPARLHACKDSRVVALKTYEQLFQKELQYQYLIFNDLRNMAPETCQQLSQEEMQRTGVFFNPASDILSFADYEAEKYFLCIGAGSYDQESIRYAAFNYSENSDSIVSFYHAMYCSRLPNLKQVYLVLNSTIQSQVLQDPESMRSLRQEILTEFKEKLLNFHNCLNIDDWMELKKGNGLDKVRTLPNYTVLYKDEFLELCAKYERPFKVCYSFLIIHKAKKQRLISCISVSVRFRRRTLRSAVLHSAYSKSSRSTKLEIRRHT